MTCTYCIYLFCFEDLLGCSSSSGTLQPEVHYKTEWQFLIPEASYKNTFLIGWGATYYNWKAGAVWILSCISATEVQFINNNDRDWAGGLKVRGSLLKKAAIRRVRMKCCSVVWCYNWPVQLHFVCLIGNAIYFHRYTLRIVSVRCAAELHWLHWYISLGPPWTLEE